MSALSGRQNRGDEQPHRAALHIGGGGRLTAIGYLVV